MTPQLAFKKAIECAEKALERSPIDRALYPDPQVQATLAMAYAQIGRGLVELARTR
jgi:hypothetical protein